MPAPIEVTGTIVAQAALPGGRILLTVSAAALARLAAPGQFAMLRCADGWDPYLRRALPFSRLDGETVSFLFAPADPGLVWLARRHLGDPVSIIGPLGRGFDLQPATRRLLLIALGEPIAPLLALASRALQAQVSVSLLAGVTVVEGLASIIPEAVELATAPTAGICGPAADLLPWADQVAAAGPAAEMQCLAHLGRTPRPGFVLCYLERHIACGLGWCGACLTEVRRGARRACSSGPVFDLTELV